MPAGATFTRGAAGLSHQASGQHRCRRVRCFQPNIKRRVDLLTSGAPYAGRGQRRGCLALISLQRGVLRCLGGGRETAEGRAARRGSPTGQQELLWSFADIILPASDTISQTGAEPRHSVRLLAQPAQLKLLLFYFLSMT